MSNVAKILRDEISRISRRETKNSIDGMGKSHRGLKKIVADLKRRVLLLEKGNKSLVAAMRRYQVEFPEKAPEEQKKVRFTSKGVRSLRRRLRLTQADFAKLVGTTPYSVYLWEKKEGGLKLRDKTKEALLSIKALRAREAKVKLGKIRETRKKGKKARSAVSKKRRRS
jgi:DNA-binding transcriptional regulator YiaG